MDRNYDIKFKNKESRNKDLMCCPIKNCNKKYKREDKLKKHVEKDHYYETRNKNAFKFNNKLKLQIFLAAESYVRILEKILSTNSESALKDESINMSCKNLLPQVFGTEISDVEMMRIFTAQQTLAKKLFDGIFVSCDWERVMEDLELFFRMGLPYYDTNFCPTIAIDFLWHSLMQNNELYKEICLKSCGVIIPHCNQPRSEEEDKKRHEYFLDVFGAHFRRKPYQPNISAKNLDDIQIIFSSLKRKYEEFVKDEEKKEYERIDNERKKQEEYEKEQERKKRFLNEFCKENGIYPEIDWWIYMEYYRSYYENGYRREELRLAANSKIKDIMLARSNMRSSC